MQLDWSKTAKHFSVNTRRKFLSWHEARRRPNNWISSHIQILFILLVSYFNNVCCTFHLGKMFIRFLSINFYIYCSLAPQLLCITVRLSGGHFSFICCYPLVSVKNKLLQHFMTPVRLSFSMLSALEDYGSQERLLHGCSNHSNLEMEAECLTKTFSYLNLNISRTKNGINKL